MQELTNGKKVCLGVSNEAAMLDIQALARKKGGFPSRCKLVSQLRDLLIQMSLKGCPVVMIFAV